MSGSEETFFNPEEIFPSLREALGEPLPEPEKMLAVAVRVKESPEGGKPIPGVDDRREIFLTNGTDYWGWKVGPLTELFRGDKQPPVLGDHPDAYNACFAMLDYHLVQISKVLGDRRDTEMREIYSQLRRRPDGKSLGFVHDYIWQAVALMLGLHVLSQAEFEAIMARLERSCRRFEQGSTSRNYAQAMRRLFDSAAEGLT
jgi:hypothetical protein